MGVEEFVRGSIEGHLVFNTKKYRKRIPTTSTVVYTCSVSTRVLILPHSAESVMEWQVKPLVWGYCGHHLSPHCRQRVLEGSNVHLPKYVESHLSSLFFLVSTSLALHLLF